MQEAIAALLGSPGPATLSLAAVGATSGISRRPPYYGRHSGGPVIRHARRDRRSRDGFILNILNAKAYAAFVALFSQFLLPVDDQVFAYLASATVCFGVAIVVDSAWLFAGGFLQSTFRNPRSARLIRIVFGILIVASVIWMLWSAGIAND